VALEAARPKFGGVLRVETEGALRSLTIAPAAATPGDANAWSRVRPLVYETLVAIDSGGLRPQLATAWDGAPDSRRWRFRMRTGVKLHSGSTIEPWQIVAALRAEAEANAWQVGADGDAIVVTADHSLPDLPWILAQPRYAVVVQTQSGEAAGTGPFRIDRIEGRVLTLRAHDDYWDGRPFLDGVRIETGRPLNEQLTDLENGRAEMIGLSPLSARRVEQRGLRVVGSRPLELVALVFEPHRSGDDLAAWRRTIVSSLNRAAIGSALQQRAEPALALLPAWLSGYPPFVAQDAGTRLTAAQVAALPVDQRSPAIRVLPSDPLARAVADRLAVDARAAGFSVAIQAPTGLAPRPDARLVRIPLAATTPERALADLMPRLGPRGAALGAPVPGAPLDAVYRTEQSLLDASVIVPVVYVPELYGTADRLESAAAVVRPAGDWNLADSWLERDKR
jgi:hypothetical protein